MEVARANSLPETKPPKLSRRSSNSRKFGTELTNSIMLISELDSCEKKSAVGMNEGEEIEMEAADFEKKEDPQFVSAYAKDIFEFCKKQQPLISLNYMDIQPDITKKMRAVLVDWLIDVHAKFNLREETLFLTVSLMDRYLGCAKIERTKLQLVGITSMLIASKYEEIYAPVINDFIYITDNAYCKEEVLTMEADILMTLDFSLFKTSILVFLNRIAHLIACEDKVLYFSRYLLELSLVSMNVYESSPVIMATSALYIANKVFRVPAMHWKELLLTQIECTESEIREFSKNLFQLLTTSDEKLTAVKRKFASEKFECISKLSFLKK